MHLSGEVPIHMRMLRAFSLLFLDIDAMCSRDPEKRLFRIKMFLTWQQQHRLWGVRHECNPSRSPAAPPFRGSTPPSRVPAKQRAAPYLKMFTSMEQHQHDHGVCM